MKMLEEWENDVKLLELVGDQDISILKLYIKRKV